MGHRQPYPSYGGGRMSGYGDQGYQADQPSNYSPGFTPPPTPHGHPHYGASSNQPMAVQYKDNSGKTSQPGQYYYSPKAQAYYNPHIQASAQAHPDTKTVVFTGPAPAGRAPDDYYKTSVCLTFFCFFPLGIVCWGKSKRCREAVRRGDYQSANQISKELKVYTEVTLGLGWFLYLIGIVFLVVVFG